MAEVSVSVIIPAYNAEGTISRAIDSVLEQTEKPNEIIVVDDGSTDDTCNILQRYQNQVKVVRQENSGASSARNTGILTAAGEFVAFLDSDDSWASTKLQEQLVALRSNPDVGFVSCHASVTDENGNLINHWEFEESDLKLLPMLFTRHAGIPGSLSAVVIRRPIFARSGLFDTSLDAQEDIDLWMRLAAVTNYHCIPKPLVNIYRQNISVSTNFAAMLDCAKRVMRKNRPLLSQKYQRQFWRDAFSGMLSDYAKWAVRDKKYRQAIKLLFNAALISRAHWRLIASIAISTIRDPRS